MPNGVETSLQGPSEADIAQAEIVHRNVLSGRTPGLIEHVRGWRDTASEIGLSLLGVGSLILATACAPRTAAVSPTETPKISIPTPEPTPPPIPTATVTREPSPTPESTATTVPSATPVPTATPKPPEVKAEPVPCIITSPELCAQAERIQIIRASGKTETYLAFNPDQKTPFFAPEDGRLLDKIKESGDPFSGFSALIYKPNPPGGAYRIIGLEFDDMIQVENPKKGSRIGYSNSSGITNFGARVLVTATKRTPEGPVTDEDALKAASPAAFEKPIKKTFTQQTPGKPNVSIHYGPNPPQ